MTSSQVKEILKAFNEATSGDAFHVTVHTVGRQSFGGAVYAPTGNGLLRVDVPQEYPRDAVMPVYIEIEHISAIGLRFVPTGH